MGCATGTSLHRYATDLDLGPVGAYAWLAANARGFGFIHRYAWSRGTIESVATSFESAGRRVGILAGHIPPTRAAETLGVCVRCQWQRVRGYAEWQRRS